MYVLLLRPIDGAVFIKSMFLPLPATGVTSIYNRYIKTPAHSPATLCQYCKAIGEKLSAIYDFEQTNIYIFIYIDIGT
jgi:hypothetical protein